MFNNKFLVLMFVAVIFLLGFLLYIYNPEPVEFNDKEDDAVVCTTDAMLCADGSYVSRVPPDCQFQACPIPKNAFMEDGTVQ